MKDGFIYKGTRLCIPRDGDQLKWIRDAHTSKVVGHFGVEKITLNLERYFYWPKMQHDVAQCILGCVLCNTSKPSNRKLGLYLPLPIHSRLEEHISVDFRGGLSLSKSGNDYMFIVVGSFNKMIILILSKKVTRRSSQIIFLNVWKYFRLLSFIIFNKADFLVTFKGLLSSIISNEEPISWLLLKACSHPLFPIESRFPIEAQLSIDRRID